MTPSRDDPTAVPKDAHAKALAINLDTSIYGSFAEIGAGQEVARFFLTVGGASGTVAQTISAYDKTFSDETYGAGTRYVSKERVLAMLDHEYQLLVARLGPSRGPESRFFAFADTVSARNYRGDNQQHGWMGLRFQAAPGAEPNDVLLHVNLMDPNALLQQQALGLLGVNLIHAAYHERSSAGEFLHGLWSELSIDRLEADVLEIKGPVFEGTDCRLWCLELLRRGMAHAIAFDSECRVVEPSTILRKRPLIVDRGRFRTIEPFHAGMLRAAERQLGKEALSLTCEPLALLEMSIQPLGGKDATVEPEVLSRVSQVGKLGPVLVTDYAEVYRLAAYLRRHTAEPIRFVLGVSLLANLMEERFYDELPGRLLEGLGKIFSQNVKVYVYPMPRDALGAPGKESSSVQVTDSASATVTADDLILRPPANRLFEYLREGQWVIPITRTDDPHPERRT